MSFTKYFLNFFIWHLKQNKFQIKKLGDE